MPRSRILDALLLLVDNRDSFVFNLDQAFRALGAETVVRRSDRSTASELLATRPEAIVLSPGPGRPEAAGCLLQLLEEAPPSVPILGVCLGHQALVLHAGGKLRLADEIWHGRCSWVHHCEQGIFEGLPNPLEACRYHSWIADESALPDSLLVTAYSEDWIEEQEQHQRTILAVSHRSLPRIGLQFHPESFRSPQGPKLLENFLRLLPTQRETYAS